MRPVPRPDFEPAQPCHGAMGCLPTECESESTQVWSQGNWHESHGLLTDAVSEPVGLSDTSARVDRVSARTISPTLPFETASLSGGGAPGNPKGNGRGRLPWE
eukprot:5411241-Amphidinium_carterae.1